ncbi:MAG: hypothetical protein ACI9VR_003844 [Cognaticolwellia sp.]
MPNTLYFVHIPKTAGRYLVVRALNHELVDFRHLPKGKIYRGKPTGKLYYGGHNVCHSRPVSNIRYFGESCVSDPEFHASRSFSIVRNPFDLLVSMYSSEWPYQSSITKQTMDSFDRFIRSYCDPAFDWVVPLQQQHLFFQLVSDDGSCAVDRLLRFENLDEELRQICAPVGIEPRVSGPFRPSRRNAQRDHRSWYTDALRDLVQEKCRLELKQLGYDFDGPTEVLDERRLNVVLDYNVCVIQAA